MLIQTTSPEKAVGSRCTVCDGDQWNFVRRGCDLYQPGCEESFELYRCLSCGQVMQNPLPTPEQLSKAYSAEYAPYRPAWKETGWPLWKVFRELTTRRRMRRLRRYGKGRKLLEVGCGAGDFLHAAHGAGWEVAAVEYSVALTDELCRELGFDVRAGELTRGLWQPGSFDVVALFSVIEHLRNPHEVLVTASSYLRTGGVVFIQIPTLRGVELGKEFGQYWALLDLPRHLSFFSRECLTELCDQAGMKLIVFQTGLLETAWCYFQSLVNYATFSRKPERRVKRLALLALRCVLFFPSMVVRAYKGHGTEAFAVAVKR
ncbi:MAG: class I SAM-dependent methyltransferase [Acidobacteriaceae bacterium]|jgi:SAM-dependent methyltransferase